MATSQRKTVPRPRGKRKTLAPRAGSRLDLFMRGELTAEDLTEEELLTGILNDKNGERSGRPANLIPREFHTAVVQRLIAIGEGKLQSAYLEAAENIIAIALGDPEKVEEKFFENGKLVGSENRSYDPVVLKAAQYVFERIGGKTPEVVAATVSVKSWEQHLESFTKEHLASPGMARSASSAIGLPTRSGAPGDGAMP
jgi:hypothetical protein